MMDHSATAKLMMILAVLLMQPALAAQAQVVGYELVIYGLGSGVSGTPNGTTTPPNDNIPLFELTNWSATSEITDFYMTIGDLSYNYDAVVVSTSGSLVSDPTVGVGVVAPGTSQGGTRTDYVDLNLTNFSPGKHVVFSADFDGDGSGDTVESFKEILWNNGPTANGVVTVTFSNGEQLVQVLSDQPSTTPTIYTFRQSTAPAVGIASSILAGSILDGDGDDDLNAFYQGEGRPSSILTGPLTSEALADLELLVVMLPDDAFTQAEIDAVGAFLAGGGRLLAIGEQIGFAATQNGYLNALLTGVGSSLQIGGASLDSGFLDTVPAQILSAHPLNAGVASVNYGNVNSILGSSPEDRLFLASNLVTVWGATEEIGPGLVVALGDSNMISHIEDQAGNDNHTFFLNVANTDRDFDGVTNGVDNCPDTFNPSREDVDGDGVGDFCDNCRDDANAGQEDTNGDDVGDVCQPARLTLVRDFLAVDPAYDVVVNCNGVPLKELNFGFTVPSGSLASSVDFGGGCDAPTLAIPGVVAGMGCTANANLGSTVNAAASGAYIPNTGFGYDDDSVYAHIEGNGVGGRLCEPGDGEVVVARMIAQSALGLGFSFLTGRGLLLNGLFEAGDLVGNQRPDPGKEGTSGASDPDVEFLVTPSAGQAVSTARRWDLCLGAESDQRMRRIAIGLRVSDSTTGNVRLLGCNPTPDMNGVRQCSADSASVLGGIRVDETQSFTVGPFASATFPTLARTLYVVLEGNLQFPGENAKSFGNQLEQLCLGTIVIDAPAGEAGDSPIFEVEGLDLLPYADMDPTPWIPTNTAIATSLDKVGFDNQFNPGDDLDNDGVLDNADNCRFTANGGPSNGQANNGDVLVAELDPDNDGDACECGDTDGSGGVFAPDLQLIREHLVGLNPGNAVAVNAICSVSEGISCNTKDAVVLERALALQAPGVLPKCDAALPD